MGMPLYTTECSATSCTGHYYTSQLTTNSAKKHSKRTQKLCDSRGGCPVLPVHNSLWGLCGRKATVNVNLNQTTEAHSPLCKESDTEKSQAQYRRGFSSPVGHMIFLPESSFSELRLSYTIRTVSYVQSHAQHVYTHVKTSQTHIGCHKLNYHYLNTVKIMHTLVETGSAAFAAVAAVPGYGDPNFLHGYR